MLFGGGGCSDNLLRDQELAYQKALDEDRQKELAKEAAAAEERRLLAEQERQKQQEEDERRAAATAVPAEPAESQKTGVCKLNFRLPNGEKVLRRFNETDTLEALFNFAHSLGYPISKGNVLQVYPRRKVVSLFSCENKKV